MRSKRLFRSFTAAVTSIFFSFSTLAWSAPAVPGIYTDHAPDGVRGLVSAAGGLEVPDSAGTVTERFSAPSSNGGAFIIHIEDAHTSLDAQENIRHLLRHLHSTYGIDLVFAEGTVGRLDSARAHFFADEDLNRRTAALLEKRGFMNGAELFLLDAQKNAVKPSAPGIEDAALYEENLAAYRSVFSGREESRRFLDALKTRIFTKASLVFNKKLKDFFRVWTFYEEVPSELMGRLDRLREAAAEDLSVDLLDPRAQREWPQLVRYFRLRAMQPPDPEQAARDLERAAAWLTSHGADAGDLEYLGKWRESSSKSGTYADLRSFLEHLYQVNGPKGFSFEAYPALAREWGMAILRGEIHGEELSEEMTRLGGGILDRLAAAPEEKALVSAYRNYLLTSKFLNLELVSRDYGEAARRGESLRPSVLLASPALAGGAPVPDALARHADEAFAKALSFYETASRRDRIMFENVMKHMRQSGRKTAVLLTGGFHAAGLRDLFRRNGVSYAGVSPHIADFSNNVSYSDVLTLKPATTGRSYVAAPHYLDEGLPAPFAAFYEKGARDAAREIARGASPQAGPSPRSEVRPSTVEETFAFIRKFAARHGLRHAFLPATGFESTITWIAGHEDENTVIEGHYVNLYSRLEHDRRLREDVRLARSVGAKVVRTHFDILKVWKGSGVYDWSSLDELFDSFEAEGMVPALDLLHFGLPEWLLKNDAGVIGFQNDAIPGEFARFTRDFMARYKGRVEIVTPVNEPMITVLFSTYLGFWNEARSDDPAFSRALRNVLKAAVLSAAEIRKADPSVLILQNESAEYYHPREDGRFLDDVNYYNDRRFVTLDLLYGVPPAIHIVNEVLKKNGWKDAEFRLFAGDPVGEEQRRELLANGWSAYEIETFEKFPPAERKRNVILGLDYYAWNEHYFDDGGAVRAFNPSTGEELGRLRGFTAIAEEFYARYGLPLMLAETHRPLSNNRPLWMTALEKWSAEIARLGIPFVGMTWYSLTHQVGWGNERPLTDEGLFEVGVFDLSRSPVGSDHAVLLRLLEDMTARHAVSGPGGISGALFEPVRSEVRTAPEEGIRMTPAEVYDRFDEWLGPDSEGHPAVLLVDGIPGTGKTTWTENYLAHRRAKGLKTVLIHHDDFLRSTKRAFAPRVLFVLVRRLFGLSPEKFSEEALKALFKPEPPERLRGELAAVHVGNPGFVTMKDGRREPLDEETLVVLDGLGTGRLYDKVKNRTKMLLEADPEVIRRQFYDRAIGWGDTPFLARFRSKLETPGFLVRSYRERRNTFDISVDVTDRSRPVFTVLHPQAPLTAGPAAGLPDRPRSELRRGQNGSGQLDPRIREILDAIEDAENMEEIHRLASALGRLEHIDFTDALRQIERFPGHRKEGVSEKEQVLARARKFLGLYHASFREDGTPEGFIPAPRVPDADRRGHFLNRFSYGRVERGISNVRAIYSEEGESPVVNLGDLPTVREFQRMTGIEFDVYGVLEYLGTPPDEKAPRPTKTGSFKRRQFVNLFVENRGQIDRQGGNVLSLINSSGNAIQGLLHTVQILSERGIVADGTSWKLGAGSRVTMVAHDTLSPAKEAMVRSKFPGQLGEVEFISRFISDGKAAGIYEPGEDEKAIRKRLENINELLADLDRFVEKWNALHPDQPRIHVRASNEESAVLGGASILRNAREQLERRGVPRIDYIAMGRGGGGPVAGMALESYYHEEQHPGERTQVWAVGSEIPTVSIADGQAIQNAQSLAAAALENLPERLDSSNVPEEWFYKAIAEIHELGDAEGLSVRVEPSAASGLAKLYAIMADPSQWKRLEPDAAGQRRVIALVLSGMNYADYAVREAGEVYLNQKMGGADYLFAKAVFNAMRRRSDYAGILNDVFPVNSRLNLKVQTAFDKEFSLLKKLTRNRVPERPVLELVSRWLYEEASVERKRRLTADAAAYEGASIASYQHFARRWKDHGLKAEELDHIAAKYEQADAAINFAEERLARVMLIAAGVDLEYETRDEKIRKFKAAARFLYSAAWEVSNLERRSEQRSEHRPVSRERIAALALLNNTYGDPKNRTLYWTLAGHLGLAGTTAVEVGPGSNLNASLGLLDGGIEKVILVDGKDVLDTLPAGNPRLAKQEGNALDLPLADASAGAVVFNQSLHFIEGYAMYAPNILEQALDEADRVLEPGGWLLIKPGNHHDLLFDTRAKETVRIRGWLEARGYANVEIFFDLQNVPVFIYAQKPSGRTRADARVQESIRPPEAGESRSELRRAARKPAVPESLDSGRTRADARLQESIRPPEAGESRSELRRAARKPAVPESLDSGRSELRLEPNELRLLRPVKEKMKISVATELESTTNDLVYGAFRMTETEASRLKDAQAVLDFLGDDPDAPSAADLLVIDHIVQGMGSLELIREIRRRGFRLPIILSSANFSDLEKGPDALIRRRADGAGEVYYELTDRGIEMLGANTIFIARGIVPYYGDKAYWSMALQLKKDGTLKAEDTAVPANRVLDEINALIDRSEFSENAKAVLRGEVEARDLPDVPWHLIGGWAPGSVPVQSEFRRFQEKKPANEAELREQLVFLIRLWSILQIKDVEVLWSLSRSLGFLRAHPDLYEMAAPVFIEQREEERAHRVLDPGSSMQVHEAENAYGHFTNVSRGFDVEDSSHGGRFLETLSAMKEAYLKQKAANASLEKMKFLVVGAGSGMLVYDLETLYGDVFDFYPVNKEPIEFSDKEFEDRVWNQRFRKGAWSPYPNGTSMTEEEARASARAFAARYRREVVLADIERELPFADGYFDGVLISAQVTTYLKRKIETAALVKRLLKKDGWGFITDFDGMSIQWPGFQPAAGLVSTDRLVRDGVMDDGALLEEYIESVNTREGFDTPDRQYDFSWIHARGRNWTGSLIIHNTHPEKPFAPDFESSRHKVIPSPVPGILPPRYETVYLYSGRTRADARVQESIRQPDAGETRSELRRAARKPAVPESPDSGRTRADARVQESIRQPDAGETRSELHNVAAVSVLAGRTVPERLRGSDLFEAVLDLVAPKISAEKKISLAAAKSLVASRVESLRALAAKYPELIPGAKAVGVISSGGKSRDLLLLMLVYLAGLSRADRAGVYRKSFVLAGEEARALNRRVLEKELTETERAELAGIVRIEPVPVARALERQIAVSRRDGAAGVSSSLLENEAAAAAGMLQDIVAARDDASITSGELPELDLAEALIVRQGILNRLAAELKAARLKDPALRAAFIRRFFDAYPELHVTIHDDGTVGLGVEQVSEMLAVRRAAAEAGARSA